MLSLDRRLLSQSSTIQVGRSPAAVATAGRAAAIVVPIVNRSVAVKQIVRPVALTEASQSMNAACYPTACTCCERWQMPPGATLPLLIDWSTPLSSMPDWTLSAVTVATLSRLDGPGAPQPAPDTEIAFASGFDTDPPESSPGWTKIKPDITGNSVFTETLVESAPDVRVGNLYRMDISVKLVDCGSRAIYLSACVTIQIQLC